MLRRPFVVLALALAMGLALRWWRPSSSAPTWIAPAPDSGRPLYPGGAF